MNGQVSENLGISLISAANNIYSYQKKKATKSLIIQYLFHVVATSQCSDFIFTGKISFNNRSLHAIGNTPNPYEKAISIIGKTLAPFDDDNLIPCFGFGDGISSFLVN